MEGKSPRGGSGSKSNSTEGDVVSNEEMAPNVNGSNKDGGTSTDYDSIEADIREMNRDLSPGPRTRKRKAAEMKTDDESEEVAIKKEPENKDDEGSINTDASTDKIEDESSSPLNDIASDLREISVPEKQVFGKGKRARVPNKRYSDLSLNKVSFDSPKVKVENGQAAEVKTEKEDVPELLEIKKTVRRSKSTSVDNLNYLKPFSYGWKRELVYRSTNDSSMRRMGDIYYYTPAGKKVRSMREVAETLPKHKDLTIADFTFTKEPLGIDDPEKEIIRDAKIKTGSAKKHVKVVSKPISTSTPTAKAKPAVATSSAKSVKSKTSFKVKMPKSTVKTKEKKSKVEPKSAAPAANDDMEIGTYPQNWTPKKQKVSNRRSDATTTRSATKLRQPAATPEAETTKAVESAKFMDTYLQNLAYGYKTLLYVFQYLKVQDLLRAGCVCTMWRDVARHPLLWKTVRMKNSQIHSFDGFAHALKEHNTAHLDLRKMLLPPGAGDEMWPEFTNALRKVDTLRKIELCRCSAEAIENLAETNPNLEVINAVTIKCESMSFNAFNNLKNLTDLRLKSTAGLTITGGVTALGELTRLKYLSLTSIKELNKANIEVLENLVNLEVLEIGECSDFPSIFGTQVLTKLTKLEKLRLEKGQGDCHTFEMLNALKSLKALSQLELVNFDIKAGFDKALGGCVNLKKLLIIPTYISQSATTNRMVLGGVLLLQKTLQHFVWGVTLELLRVTELFVDQCEQPDKESKDKTLNTGDSIPVLKPVPFHGISQPEIPPSSDTPQVEILPLPNLQKLLLQNLPTTRVRILKIPFHATWRQSITDSVNY